MGEYLQMQGIEKVYNSFGREVHALKGVDLSIRKGTVHGLLGENGAGKSTIMKILVGVEKKDKGTVILDGKEVDIKNAIQAAEHGIGMVHQHFSLLEKYSVIDNVILGAEPTKFLNFIDRAEARKRVEEAAKKCGYDDIDLDAKVGSLSMGQQQKVEIMRILYSNADIFVFDEPTSVLVEQEIRGLLNTIRRLKEQGKTIVYISHKVDEILEITDEVSVLRNGEKVSTGVTAELSSGDLVRMMVGKDVKLSVDRPPHTPGEVMLQVDDLHVMHGKQEAVKGVSFQVRQGEIVAVAGINGNGQPELIEALFGLRKVRQGKIVLEGKDITGSTPLQRRNAGMAYIPEDRVHVGSCGTASIMENIMIDRYRIAPYSSKAGWLNWKKIRETSRELIKRYEVKAPDEEQNVGALSGGHIQRTILSRELTHNPRFMLACEITMGLDVASTRYIHDSMLELREKDMGVLLVSSNINEIMDLADRILVIHAGELTACLENDGSISMEELGEYMLGLRYQDGFEPRKEGVTV